MSLILLLLSLACVSATLADDSPGIDFRSSRTNHWSATHDCSLTGSDEGLKIDIQGDDPYCMGPMFPVPDAERLVVRIRMKSQTGGAGQLFYFTRETREEDSVRFGVAAGDWHDVWLTIPRSGPAIRFRLDPPGTSGTCLVESITVQPGLKHTWPAWAEQAPLAGDDTITMTGGSITLRHSRSQAGQFEIDVLGRPTATSGVKPQIALANQDKIEWSPLESRSVTTVGEHTIRSIATAALPEGGELTLTQQFTRSGFGTLECRSELSTTKPCQLVYAPLLLLFPGHHTFGDQKHQGLFAGVEYLENEPSSSEADVDAARALRRVPSYHKITMPLMALETDGRYLGLTWEPQPENVAACFDSPDRLFGTKSHVMGLIAPGAHDGRREDGRELPQVATLLTPDEPWSVTSRILGGAANNVTAAVQHAIEWIGLPEMPEIPDDSVGLLAHGWLDTPLKIGNRFRHAVVGETFHPQPAGDAIWMMMQLAAAESDPVIAKRLCDAAESAHAELPVDHFHHAAVGHVRYPNGTLLLGDATQGISQARQAAAGQLAQLGPECRIEYHPHADRPDFSRTHWTKEANGLDAPVVSRALSEAIFSGDQKLIDQALSQLRKLDRYSGSVPRGAQTWEIPLHTPDILASAHLMTAFLQGYEITRDPKFLEQARYWAWTGVPFIYLKPQFNGKIGPYATIPVLGATHWNSVLWIGLPVQWCGLVYAEALHDLAKYDDQGPWKQLADGIVRSGLQQTYPDGPHKGLLPDSFNVQGQSRNPADINPGTLQIPAMRTLKGWRSYEVRKILESGWTVISPCGIELQDTLPARATFQVDGWPHQPYSILIHGLNRRPVVEVRKSNDGSPVTAEDQYIAESGTLILKVQGAVNVTLDISADAKTP